MPALLQTIRDSTHCRCWGCACPGILGVHFLMVRLPTMASGGSVPTPNRTPRALLLEWEKAGDEGKDRN